MTLCDTPLVVVAGMTLSTMPLVVVVAEMTSSGPPLVVAFVTPSGTPFVVAAFDNSADDVVGEGQLCSPSNNLGTLWRPLAES